MPPPPKPVRSFRMRALASLLSLCTVAVAADLTSSGDWFESVTSANLAGGAGSNLTQPESVAGITTLTIANAPGVWRIKARRSGISWPSGCSIWIKRTSNGSGSGSISGGNAFIELGTTDVEIFNGSQNRNGVSLQFKVTGLSVNHPPGNLSSSIIFTLQ